MTDQRTKLAYAYLVSIFILTSVSCGQPQLLKTNSRYIETSLDSQIATPLPETIEITDLDPPDLETPLPTTPLPTTPLDETEELGELEETENRLPEIIHGQFKLDIGEVYYQGQTNWCWAYSAFHVLRSYYNHLPEHEKNEETESWHEAILDLDYASEFEGYMAQNRNRGSGGDPLQFLSLIKKSENLPGGAQWEYFTENSRSRPLDKLISDNILKGIPSSYCYPWHCVMIYGFEVDSDGDITGFHIADSGNGRTYLSNADKVMNDFDMFMTLDPQKESHIVEGSEPVYDVSWPTKYN